MASVSKNRQGKWVVRFRDAQDRQHSKVIPGPKANALKLKADIEARQALGHLYEAKPETLGAYLEGWLGREAQRVRASTCQRRREALRGLGVLDERDGMTPPLRGLSPPSRSSSPSTSEAGVVRGSSAVRPESGPKAGSALASEYLVRITAAEIEDAVQLLLARGASRQAQIALRSLQLALEDADTRGQRFDARILRLKVPRHQPKRAVRFLDWPEIERLASWMPEHSKRIVLVAALTGLRQGELFGLRESDLHLGEGYLTVERSGDGPTKTAASERRVELIPLAVETVKEQLVARRHTKDGLVFPAWEGGMMRANNFNRREFQPACRRAGLEGVVFHHLRHSFVSLAGHAGLSQEVIEHLAGWSPGAAKAMYARYRHVYPEERDVGIKKLEALVRPGAKAVKEGKVG